jgi:hypothetical protein
MIALVVALIAVFAVSYMAYWRGNPIFFMAAAGISIMAGLYSPRCLHVAHSPNLGLAVGLMLILYAFVSLALGYVNLLKNRNLEGKGQ